ncbi:MAG: SAM-dependent methyltransferase [Chloroflexota bacterium]|nr:MAG: SAM-dependent methyltransferase [Chloroflexota bacterium]
MDDDLRAAIAKAWQRGAADYDREPRHGLLHEDEWIAWRRLFAAILGDPLHAGVPRLRVLDVGTGTGVVALLVAELGHEVTGLDASPAMLERARAKAQERGLVVDWRLGDAEALPVDLGGFDVVVARQLLWTLPHPARALAAWRDAARPGGLVAILDGWWAPWPAPMRPFVAVAERLADGAGAAAHVLRRRGGQEVDRGHEYEPAILARLPLARLADPGPVVELLRETGLEGVRIQRLREIEAVERRHLPWRVRLLDRWRRYLATGRVPHLVAAQVPPS